jgi:hypothetical protein
MAMTPTTIISSRSVNPRVRFMAVLPVWPES